MDEKLRLVISKWLYRLERDDYHLESSTLASIMKEMRKIIEDVSFDK